MVKKGSRAAAKAAAEAAEAKRLETLKQDYLSQARATYSEYRKTAKAMAGTPLADFPKLKFHRPPKEIAGDREIRRALLSYWRGGDDLRVKMASNVPYARNPKRQQSGGDTISRQHEEQRGGFERHRDDRV